MKKLTLANLNVSEEGIPYIYYRHDNPRRKGFHSEIRVPIVRIAYDILMRTHFEYFYGCYNAPYNRLIQKLLRFCGIDRKVLLYNSRTGVSEEVPICEAFNQGNIHPTHMDILHDMESMRGLRGPTFTGQRTLEQMNELPIEEHFRRLNLAFGQKSYRVDENLNIIDGAPFEPRDPMIYKEVPEKKFKGGTVPYIIEEIHAMAPGEAEPEDRIEVRYHQHLLKERPLLLCGDQFPAYLAGMDSKRQRKVQYGLLLLRRLGSFDVPFVKKEKGTIYSLRTELRGCTDATYFYINAGTIVILQGHRLEKANGKIKPPKMEELEMMRWAHVIGQTTATDYGAVLDGILGAPGTKAREKSWAGACSNFVNQALIAFRRVARHQDYTDPIKDEVGAISNVGHRERTLPYRYLRRILKALNCRVVITRMVSDEEIENLRRRPTAEVE